MISKEERSKGGAEAANRGIANEHIALGVLMYKYSASQVDLPSSKYDLIIEQENNFFIRIQSKAEKKGIKFYGNVRAGEANYGSSNPDKAYRYSRTHCDVIMGVETIVSKTGILKKVNLYFLPTIVIENLQTKSISYGCIKGFKNNWKVLENSKDEDFIWKIVKKLIKKKKLKLNLINKI